MNKTHSPQSIATPTIIFLAGLILTAITNSDKFFPKTQKPAAKEKKLAYEEAKKILAIGIVAAHAFSQGIPCPCPYSRDRLGNPCGNRSEWNRPSGRKPLCYTSELPTWFTESQRKNIEQIINNQ